MDVILSQLTRAQLQTHSAEALHAELQQLEGVFKCAVQTLQRISSVRDTAAKFLVDCDDSATLTHLTRIHALREDATMRLDLLMTEIHVRRRDAECQARKKTASPSPVKSEGPPQMQASSVVPPGLVIDCMSPLSSPALTPAQTPAPARQALQGEPTLSSPAPIQPSSALAVQPPAVLAQSFLTQVSPTRMDLAPQPQRNENEIEISDSGSDTESDDEDIPVSALLGRQQQQQPSGSEPQQPASTRSNSRSTTAQMPSNSDANSEGRVKAEAKRTRIPSDASVQSPAESRSTTLSASQLQHQVLSTNDQQQQQKQQTVVNLSKNQLKKLKKKKSKAMKKATAGSGGIVHTCPGRVKRTERRRLQFQK